MLREPNAVCGRKQSTPQPGCSFCSETADPASKQPEAVESVNHSFTAHMLWMQKASGGVPAGFFFLTGQIISTPLGVSAHVIVNVKQHLPGTDTYSTGASAPCSSCNRRMLESLECTCGFDGTPRTSVCLAGFIKRPRIFNKDRSHLTSYEELVTD